MKKITTGILAHVDAGKTTLSEGFLFLTGGIRNLGRVDKGNTFLDTDEIEKNRGITVFSKQAVINTPNSIITLLDTPGHVDFSTEAERTLGVLDYAILLISGSEGIQAHTKTLWNMLSHHNIPTFIFINKMDLAGSSKEGVISSLKEEFGDGFVDFSIPHEDELCEALAFCDETLMQHYLDNESLQEDMIKQAIKRRKVFPCFCGSALKLEGVERFLNAFDRLTLPIEKGDEFGARVFKIDRDSLGNRLTFLKVTSGELCVKSLIEGEKVNEIRLYSGDKYTSLNMAEAGDVCAVTGLTKTYPGMGIGVSQSTQGILSQPIFTYRIIVNDGTLIQTVFEKLKLLQEKDPSLDIMYNGSLKEINIRIMGEIQLEVLKEIILKDYGIDVSFDKGRVLYKETILNRVEGVGHYEPLRHYSEVRLLMEPLPQGSGLQFESRVSEDVLDKNWQRLILTHLMEKNHTGVLTGSPITDIKIILTAGRAHLKHTEGGDFRQATYRAVRQGLMKAQCALLEPYYSFTLEIPTENAGRAMTDLSRMEAEFSMPETRGDMCIIKGTCPASKIQDYQQNIVSYTHGKGKISFSFSGYGKCTNSEEVITSTGYLPECDTQNPADSVFCANGAGFTVKWDEVDAYAHTESVLKPVKPKADAIEPKPVNRAIASDEELLRIFEMAYGKQEQKNPNTMLKTPKDSNHKTYRSPARAYEKEYLLVDGYNIIFAWDELKEIAKDSLEQARLVLTQKLSAYKLYKNIDIIIVFDAYKVKGNPGTVEKLEFLTVVYTKEAQTADSYIEKTATSLAKNYKVTVATSDNLEQLIIFGSGAFRMSASTLVAEINSAENAVRGLVKEYNSNPDNADFLKVLKDKF